MAGWTLLTEDEMLRRARLMWQAHAQEELAAYRALVLHLCEQHGIDFEAQCELAAQFWPGPGYPRWNWATPENEWDTFAAGPDEALRILAQGGMTRGKFREIMGEGATQAEYDLERSAKFYYGLKQDPDKFYCPTCDTECEILPDGVRCPNCDETLHLGDGWHEDWLARRDDDEDEQ